MVYNIDNMKEKYIPNVTDIKILVTVEFLNDLGYYPLPQGVLKILSGVIDFETKDFLECPTFQTIISYNSKKISRSILLLVRYCYLEKKYDEKTNELYLKMGERGKGFLLSYRKHHKLNYKKHQKTEKRTIVKI